MNLSGLLLLFLIYTLVIAAVVGGVIYFGSRRQRKMPSGLPIPNVAGLNIKPLRDRSVAPWPVSEPAPPHIRTVSPERKTEPVSLTSVGRSTTTAPKTMPLGRPTAAAPASNAGRQAADRAPLGLDAPPERDVEAPARPLAGNRLPDIFADGAPLLPEGLRTLEVTPKRTVEPGTIVHASLTFRNPGGAAARGFSARFRLPEGLMYVAGSARVDDLPLADAEGRTPLLLPSGADFGEIPAGGERRVSLAYVVASTIENGTPVHIQAAIASAEVAAIGSNIVKLIARSRPILDNPQAALSLTASGEARPGEELVVKAQIRNTGQSSAHDVVVLLPQPAHTSFVPDSFSFEGKSLSQATRNSPFGAGRPTIVCSLLEPQEMIAIAYRVRIDTPLEDGTRIVAGGAVYSAEVAQFALAPATIEISSAPSFAGDGTGLLIACTDFVEPGEHIAFVLAATNAGTAPARGIAASIVLPYGLAFTAGSIAIDGAPVPDHGLLPSDIALGDLAPGESTKIAFSAVVQSPIANGSSLGITSALKWSGGRRTFERILTARSAPKFPASANKIERETATPIVPGDAIAYLVALQNTGTDVATGVRLRLDGGPGLEIEDVRSATAALCADAEGSIALEPLHPGVPHVLRVTARAADILADRTSLQIRAALHGVHMIPLALDAPIDVVESGPNFTLATSGLRAESEEALRFGRVSTYRIRLFNEGSDAGRDLRVVLDLPDELRLESVEGARSGDAVLFGEIPAHETREAVIGVRLVGAVAGGDTLTIGARLEGSNFVPFRLAPVKLTTRSQAAFADGASLTSMPVASVDAGMEIAYTLALRNSGDGTAKRLELRITSLSNAVYAQNSTVINGVALQDHAGTSLLLTGTGLQLADIAPGVEVLARFRAIVNMPVPPGTLIETAAVVRWEEGSELSVSAPAVSVRSSSALPVIEPELPFSVLGAVAAASAPRRISSGDRLRRTA